jgi:AcrR family transcriptional regulator
MHRVGVERAALSRHRFLAVLTKCQYNPEMPVTSPVSESSLRRRRTPGAARQEILDQVIDMLWERPIRDLSTTSIMNGTGLSRPAFYQYFPNVHNLVEQLLADLEVELVTAAMPWFTASGDSRAALRESLRGIIAVCVQNGPVFRAISESAPLDARLEIAWAAFMGRWDDAVSDRIALEQKAGTISPLDGRAIAVALNRLDASTLVAEFGRRPQGDPTAVLDTLYHIWIKTLYTEPSADFEGLES